MPKKQKTIQEYTNKPVSRQRLLKMAEKNPADSLPTPTTQEGGGYPAVLAEIKLMRTEITGKIDALDVKFTLLQAHVSQISDSLKNAEERIEAVEARVNPMERTLSELQTALSDTSARLADQEGRNRRNNVRLIGFPENSEKTPFEPFYESLIKDLFPEAPFSPMFVLERAHRALSRKPPPGAAPRPVILRFLNYRDRDTLLRAARERGEVRHQGTKLSFYQDFTIEVQNARKDFTDVKRKLREKGLQYAMLYPSRLRVISGGKIHFFTDSAAAMSFVTRAPPGQIQRDQNQPGTSNTAVTEDAS